IFIDVGANIGYYTLLASQRVGASGKVFAIEANSGTYAKLLRNIARNRATNVAAVHIAVSDRPGRVSVWQNRDGELAGSTILTHVAERRRAMTVVETVEAKPLPDIINPDVIRNARIIKIDVEGAEWAVVKSIADLLRTVSSQTEFIIEINPEMVRRSGGSVEALIG